jgi:hypothetical protein
MGWKSSGCATTRTTSRARWAGSQTVGMYTVRHVHRTIGRPAGAPPVGFFDDTTDWCADYAAATGRAYHAEDHFVQVRLSPYCPLRTARASC